MSAQNSTGIQTLLDAEREAQKIPENVGVIPSDRTKRIKDAKFEAQKEIDEYKQSKDEEFKKFETEHSSGNKKAEDEANQDAEAQLQAIQDIGREKGDDAVNRLIQNVLDVSPTVPEKIVTKA
ncbi:hypothetical protein FQN57_000751 [Myotisia sp. PD_48]|nr:hypothetical protein FQN57_000751 [Myotisia sp. PD_48]